MANEVTFDVEIDAPAAVVFGYLTDYTKASTYMYGLEKLESVTEQTRGLGSKFEGTIKVGATLSAGLETVEFEEGKRLVLKSYKGIQNTSDWTVTPISDSRSRVTLQWEYDLGSGLAARALGKIVEPVMKIAAASSGKDLKKAVEASL